MVNSEKLVRRGFHLAGVTFLFGLVYMAYSRMTNDEAFGFRTGNLIDPFYFSFTTMSTVGYGDYSPKDDIAKMLVMIHQFILIGEFLTIISP